jgi:hypothetical protein
MVTMNRYHFAIETAFIDSIRPDSLSLTEHSIKNISSSIFGVKFYSCKKKSLEKDIFVIFQDLILPSPRILCMQKREVYQNLTEHIFCIRWNGTDYLHSRLFLTIVNWTDMQKYEKCILLWGNRRRDYATRLDSENPYLTLAIMDSRPAENIFYVLGQKWTKCGPFLEGIKMYQETGGTKVSFTSCHCPCANSRSRSTEYRIKIIQPFGVEA